MSCKLDLHDFKYAMRSRLDYTVIGDNGSIICNVCERHCRLKPGSRGFCGNYANIDGVLYHIGYGLLSAIESRPIEIKPFYHYWPGSTAITFSNWGCNFRCPWCQNYHLSFELPKPKGMGYFPPEKIVELALKFGDEGVCASFNEPTTQADYLIDVFKYASEKGLYSTIVSNGYMTINTLSKLIESGMDGARFDIKGCPETYRKWIWGLDPNIVFRNAEYALKKGVHIEMIFLVIPGVNDWDECVEWVLEKHICKLGEDVPLHVNRYYPAYKFYEPPTPISTLIKVYEKAKSKGIKFVYIGNVGDPKYETTYCPKCGKPVIVRYNYEVIEYKLDSGNRCPRCGEKIPIRGKFISKSVRWKYLY